MCRRMHVFSCIPSPSPFRINRKCSQIFAQSRRLHPTGGSTVFHNRFPICVVAPNFTRFPRRNGYVASAPTPFFMPCAQPKIQKKLGQLLANSFFEVSIEPSLRVLNGAHLLPRPILHYKPSRDDISFSIHPSFLFFSVIKCSSIHQNGPEKRRLQYAYTFGSNSFI